MNLITRSILPVIIGSAAVLLSAIFTARAETDFFQIRVEDEQTGRGVPLVELETVHRLRFVTDNAGVVAFSEPGLLGREVFFSVRSHGYEYLKDGFGYAGTRLTTKAGGSATLKVRRLNVAERLYRVTGAGLYRDSTLLGHKTPLAEPLLNAEVLGQDSVQTALYQGKIFWFWGDTLRARYPLGHFRTSGATSELPKQGGLDPAIGVNLRYFTDADGFSRPMCPLDPAQPGVVWIDGVCVVPDAAGRERMVAHYSRMKSLGERLEHGLAVFDDEKERFEAVAQFDLKQGWQCPGGQADRPRDGERDYVYFSNPFPIVRVKAQLEALRDPTSYEVWSKGAWTPSGDPARTLEEAGYQPADVESGKPVRLHSGSVHWNAFRKRWVLIAVAQGGTSALGEVWYSEAREQTGPWARARKIITHDRYSFYNPSHHPFFDQEGGRVIYFEGTYTEMFSGAPTATPLYDYNQIMYRLDLADPRLEAVHGE